MYGIAKGAVSESTAIFGLDFEPIYDTSIQRVTLGPPPAPNSSITKSGMTIYYGANEDEAISFQGGAASTYFCFSGDDDGNPPTGVKGTTWKKGYYCWASNVSVNGGGSRWGGTEIKIELGKSSAEYTFSKLDSDTTSFYLSEDCGPIGYYRYRFKSVYHGGSYTGVSYRPRLYYVGENPFSKMSTNCAVFAKCSNPGSLKYLITDSASFTPSENCMIVRLDTTNGEIGNFVGLYGSSTPTVNFGHNFISAHNIAGVDVKTSSGTTKPISFVVRNNKDVLNYNTGRYKVIYAIKTI